MPQSCTWPDYGLGVEAGGQIEAPPPRARARGRGVSLTPALRTPALRVEPVAADAEGWGGLRAAEHEELQAEDQPEGGAAGHQLPPPEPRPPPHRRRRARARSNDRGTLSVSRNMAIGGATGFDPPNN